MIVQQGIKHVSIVYTAILQCIGPCDLFRSFRSIFVYNNTSNTKWEYPNVWREYGIACNVYTKQLYMDCTIIDHTLKIINEETFGVLSIMVETLML